MIIKFFERISVLRTRQHAFLYHIPSRLNMGKHTRTHTPPNPKQIQHPHTGLYLLLHKSTTQTPLTRMRNCNYEIIMKFSLSWGEKNKKEERKKKPRQERMCLGVNIDDSIGSLFHSTTEGMLGRNYPSVLLASQKSRGSSSLNDSARRGRRREGRGYSRGAAN